MTKTTVEIIADLRAALAHHEGEASRIRGMLSSAELHQPVAPPLPAPMVCHRGRAICFCPNCLAEMLTRPAAFPVFPAPAPPTIWPPQGPFWVGDVGPIVPGGILGGATTITSPVEHSFIRTGCANPLGDLTTLERAGIGGDQRYGGS